jgi:hypothetical protein
LGTRDHTVLVSVLRSRKWLPADITLHFRTRPLRRTQYRREDNCAKQFTNLINRSLEKQQKLYPSTFMDRIRFRFQRNRLRLQERATEASTTPTFTTFDGIELGPTSIAYPLEFLSDDRFWQATIVRSAIVNAISNIRATEERCRSDYQYAQQSSRQLRVCTQAHCNQVQRLAQLANRHAQLCYSFSHAELVSISTCHSRVFC